MNPKHVPFIEVVYGSRLYGTNTPDSDTDKKVIYLPSIDSLLLNEKIATYKSRYDSLGNLILDDDASMPPNGVETEYIPIQTFVRDFVLGQTYAIEIAFAHCKGCAGAEPSRSYEFVCEMITKFRNKDIKPMVDFAVKQTFDYVRRGERLKAAEEVLAAVENVQMIDLTRHDLRLDTELVPGKKILDMISNYAGLPIGELENNGRMFRTLEFNGRSYLETSRLSNFREAIVNLVKGYGDRVIDAAKNEVDYKSLSHAIRVYDQGIELLETGKITFPRPHADYYRSVKQGLVDLEEVKKMLVRLDDEINVKIESSKLPERTADLVKAAEEWLLLKLHDFYSIRVG